MAQVVQIQLAAAQVQTQARAERTQVTLREVAHPCMSQSSCCMSHVCVCVCLCT